jgi:hypothetical protein
MSICKKLQMLFRFYEKRIKGAINESAAFTHVVPFVSTNGSLFTLLLISQIANRGSKPVRVREASRNELLRNTNPIDDPVCEKRKEE